MNSCKATPMMEQYLEIKQQYQDSILFYRMGDFYEMFFEDAKIASRLLDIALTSRNKHSQLPVAMCGVPAKAADPYIAKLIDHGRKVAICEQIEDPATAKGLLKRDVVRIITPGMIIDEIFLDGKTNNYILALAFDGTIAGLSYLDISTGTFFVTEFQVKNSDIKGALLDEALRISPNEIILPKSAQQHHFFAPAIKAFSEKYISFEEDDTFDPDQGKIKLIDQFQTRSLVGFGCADFKAGLGAAGAILSYVKKTQLQKTDHITSINSYNLNNYLFIDNSSCKNLEILNNLITGKKKGSLLGVIDNSVTAMGGRLLKRWLRYPLLDKEEIEQRLDAINEVKNNIITRKILIDKLKSVFDLERLASKITMGRCNARDLIALKTSLNLVPDIVNDLKSLNSFFFTKDFNADFVDILSGIAFLIEGTIREDAPPLFNEGGIIKIGYDEKLDELIKLTQDGKSWIAQLETKERKKTGINSLKVKYNKVFGYFIEVSKNAAKDVPLHYIRKQTLVNNERYITEELKSFEEKVLGANDLRISLENEIFNKIRDKIKEKSYYIFKIARYIAKLDCLLGLAELADNNNYCRPDINLNGVINIKHGRHPVVEKLITGERYVPNSIKLDNQSNQVLIITGPNMAGKSTVLRQVALITLMAQMGSFVPATEASISITDKIFTRVGALDNLSHGQSTFMVEMEETANIMHNATPESLVIIDEIGRGTSTYDGLSIAWAAAEFFHDFKDKGVKTLFATHYHELTELVQIKQRVKNFNIAVKEHKDNIIFLRKLVQGATNKSYGIQVANLAGVPSKVIKAAKKVLLDIENGKQPFYSSIKNSIMQDGQIQLDFSQSSDSNIDKNNNALCDTTIIEKLKNINIESMTPIEALNYLSELKNSVIASSTSYIS